MKNAFVLLESMNHMAFVLQEARSRGHAIVVLNHDPVKETGPYGVPPESVDELIPIDSWQDRDRVQAVLDDVQRRYRVVGTYAGFEATLPHEAALRELAGLPNNGSENVRFVLDKGAVRRKLYREGLSGLRSALLHEARRWQCWPFDRGAVLKPVNGAGSALCFLVSSLDELREAAQKIEASAVINTLLKAYIASRGEFVVEEMAEGELLSVESLVDRGEVHFIGLTSRYVLAADPVVEMGSSFPYHHPRLREIVAVSEALHRSLRIYHGPTHLELMVPPDGPIELIDFNIRFAGVDSLVCFNEAFNLRFEACLTDLACGLTPDLSFLARPTQFAAEVMVLPPPGATEIRELVFPPAAVFARLTKEPGKPLSGRADQLDHIGVFVVKADTEAEVHEKALDARRRVVLDGEPLGDNVNNRVAFSEVLGSSPGRPDPEAEQVAATALAARVDDLFRRHAAERFSGEALAALQAQFQREHVVPLRGFCPPELFAMLRDEAFGILDRFGVARDLVLPISDDTPRQMTTVGQPIIKDHGPVIHAAYFSPVLKDILSSLVGEEVFTCPYPGEHYVISQLRRSGDTHGWHWDDYTYGFVLILEAPDYRDGGFVQGVPRTPWNKKDPDVHGALLQSQVHSYALSAGDAYVIKADTTMHRVYPIRGESRRTIVNMTWASAADLSRPVTHEAHDLPFNAV